MLLRGLDRNQAAEKAQLFDLLNWQINKTGAKLYLDKTSTRLQKSGLRVEVTIMEGLVAESIADFAQSQGMKLIILSSHGRSGLSQWGISSVTQKIIFSAPTSVLIIRAHQPTASDLDERLYTELWFRWTAPVGQRNVLPMVTVLARFHQIPDPLSACSKGSGNGAADASGS